MSEGPLFSEYPRKCTAPCSAAREQDLRVVGHTPSNLGIDVGSRNCAWLALMIWSLPSFRDTAESGTVGSGKLADLVLLSANPLDDVENAFRQEAVMLHGKLFPESELQSTLAPNCRRTCLSFS